MTWLLPRSLPLACLILVPTASAAVSPTHWRPESTKGVTTVEEDSGRYVYDPSARLSLANRSSARLARPLKLPVDRLARGFTLEAIVKIDNDPKRHAIAAAYGDHAIGTRFLRNWNQTYWGAFSSATRLSDWQTGHYVTISRLVAPVPGKHDGNLNWRHLALVYDADAKTMTCWLDRWQQAAQPVTRDFEPGETLWIGGNGKGNLFPGLIDEVRLTPRALEPHEFLLPTHAPLRDVEFNTPDNRFPRDAGHLDIRRHFGAVGDGVHDDTAAFQQAMRDCEKHTIVYVPNGTYLLNDTIRWRQWKLMIGESEKGTILRLKDQAPGYDDPAKPKPVIRTLFNNNQSFENTIQHLTVDTGSGNPGAIGIRYNAHNTGEVGDVTIRSGDGAGAIGLDLSETEFGPALIRNVTIEGFDIGIKTPGNVSHATMENISLRGQNVVGFRNHFPVSLYGFKSINRVPAIENAGWMAQLTLLDAELIGTPTTTNPAIVIRRQSSGDFRRVKISGYPLAIHSDQDGGSIPVTHGGIQEHLIGKSHTLFDQPPSSLDLPIESAPAPFVEPVNRWIRPDPSATDDTVTLQNLLNSGAATIYLQHGVTYTVSDTLRVPPTVRRIVGMKASLRGDPKIFKREKPMLRFEGTGRGLAPIHVEHLGVSFHPRRGYAYEVATSRDVVIRWSSGLLRNTAAATGRLFIEEQMGWVHLLHPQRAWIRQLDTEGHQATPDNYETYLINRGGTAWVLGMKTEWFGVHAETTDGGQTEILGGFFRDHVGSKGIPFFRTIDSDLTANYFQYAWRPGAARSLQAIETQNGITRRLELRPNNAVIGRYRAGSGGQP